MHLSIIKHVFILLFVNLLFYSCSEKSGPEQLNPPKLYGTFEHAFWEEIHLGDTVEIQFKYSIEDPNYIFKKLEYEINDNPNNLTIKEFTFKILTEYQPSNNQPKIDTVTWKYCPPERGGYGIYMFNTAVADTLYKFLLVDPEESFTLQNNDYQYIVDSVKNNPNLSQYVDDYGTGEYYFGANSYYTNFDLRIERRISSGQSEFESMTEEEAMDLIWERVIAALKIVLNNHYPDPNPNISYITYFDVYTNSFIHDKYKAKFLYKKQNGTDQFELQYKELTR
jgi:hypothetical protein